MGNKIPGNGKGHKDNGTKADAPKGQRRRIGPETYPTDSKARYELWREVHAKAAESGDLIVDLPAHVVDPGEGRPPIIAGERWCHPAVGKLEALAAEFKKFAASHLNDEAAAVAHILGAVSKALNEGDVGALNEDKGPHVWARRYLRPPEGRIQYSGPLLPIAQRGSPGRTNPLTHIAGGFAILEKAIQVALDEARARGVGLDGATDFIALVMAINFPSVPSLSEEPDVEKRSAEIAKNIRKRLRALGAQGRSERSDIAARDITEALLQDELRRSGRDEAEIERAFGFLKAALKN